MVVEMILVNIIAIIIIIIHVDGTSGILLSNLFSSTNATIILLFLFTQLVLIYLALGWNVHEVS